MRIGIGLAVAALALTGCGSPPEEPTNEPPEIDRATWMADLFATDPNIALSEIAIPGTHDSGSAGIDVAEPCDVASATGTPQVITDSAAVNPCAAAAMFRAQDLTLAEQLREGVRYLDLRVAADAASQLVLAHELVSMPLTDGLDGLLSFAAEHPKEQVIVDFQHVDLPQEQRQAFADLLTTHAPTGAQPLCSLAWDVEVMGLTPQTAPDVTLQQAWQTGRSLLVLVPDGVLPASPCYLPRDNALMSQWPNTQDPAKSAAANETYLQERQTRRSANPPQCQDDANPSQGSNWCGLFVNQLQLTFQDASYAACIADSRPHCSLFALSQEVNDSVAGAVAQWHSAGWSPNIVIVDYIQESNPSIIDAVIELNLAN